MPFTQASSLEMREAIKQGDYEFVKARLHGEKLKNTRRYHNWLRLALKHHHPGIFMKLVEHGAPVTGYEENGRDTLLHLAVELDDDDAGITGLLLEHGLNVVALNEHNETPIHVAAKERNMHVLEQLIEYYIAIEDEFENLEDDEGLSLFHIISMGQNTDNLWKFLNHTSHITNASVSPTSEYWPGYNPLHFAVAHYRIYTIEALIACGLDMESRTSKGLTTLHLACTVDISDWILKEAIPLEAVIADEETIHTVLENLETIMERREIVFNKLLEVFSNDIDIRDNKGDNALMYLVKNNYNPSSLYKILESKLQNIEEVYFIKEIKSLLVRKQIQNIQRLFICYNIDYLAFEGNWNTVNKPQIVQLDLVNNSGLTCLHHLALLPHPHDIPIKLLIKFGADPNKLNYDCYNSPLHFAAQNKLANFIKAILHFQSNKLEKMVNVNVQNLFGNTPLHNIFEKIEHKKMGNYFYELLKYGSDINIANENGVTVFSFIHHYILKIIKHNHFKYATYLYNDTIHLIYNSDSPIFKNEEILQLLNFVDVKFVAETWKHFIMLKTCNSPIEQLSQNFLNEIGLSLHINHESIQSSLDFKHTCELEVKHMKRLYFSKFVCLYDLMTKNYNTVALYTENDVLKQVLESPYLKKLFPTYHRMLKARFVKGLERKQLLRKATESLRKLIKLDMPQMCFFSILSFLSDMTLRKISDANHEE